LSVYREGRKWLLNVNLFFFEEKWFFDEDRQKYLSIRDLLSRFWKQVLGYMPVIKPNILNFGEVDATSRGSVPYLEYPELLKPLNTAGEKFLKDTPPSKLCDLFETIGDAYFKEFVKELPEGVLERPLNAFIYSLKENEKALERSTQIYDAGCPVTMMICNIPHEIGHFLHFRGKKYWKKDCNGGDIIYYNYTSNYIDEGVAELVQLISVEPILKKFPMLYHDNFLKHYIFSHKSPGNNHTWGLLWMKTAYEILNRNFNRLFYLATEPGISFEDFISSPVLQTEQVVKLSGDTKPVAFNRQTTRRRRFSKFVFPSVIIECDGDSFKVESIAEKEFLERFLYLQETEHLDFNNPLFSTVLSRVVKDSMSIEKKLEELFYFTRDSVEFCSDASLTASEVLKKMKAVCYTKAMLYVSFCRKLGVPAKLVVECFYIKGKSKKPKSYHKHGIAKIYYNKKWIYIDTVSNRDSWRIWGVPESVEFEAPVFSLKSNVAVNSKYISDLKYIDFETNDVPEYWINSLKKFKKTGKW
ncbi:hypothetical protein DRQ09_07395, partial [candidate division KSB1 bacterium]